MPVTVRVPVTVVVDLPALDTRLDDLGRAVEAATTRALTNAVAVLRERHGAYLAHEAVPPLAAWRGDALGEVPAGQRAQAERAVLDAVLRAAAAVLADRPRVGAPPADRLVRGPAEFRDDERLAPAAGLYTVPGYQDGEPIAVPVDEPPEVVPAHQRLVWEPLPQGAKLWQRARAALIAYYGDRFPAQLGFIGRRAGGRFLIYVERRSDQQELVNGSLALEAEEFQVRGTTVVPVRTPYLPPAEASFRIRRLGSAATVEERLRIFHDQYGADVARLVRAALPPDIANADELVRDRTDLTARRWAAGLPAGTRCLVLLQVDATPFVLHTDADLAADLDAELVPLTVLATEAPESRRDAPPPAGPSTRPAPPEDAERSEEADDAEDADATEEPGTGGPLGTEGGTSFWPGTRAPGAEPAATPTCARFLGEPDAAELVDDGGLRAGMAALAEELELRRDCRHLGGFALYAAEMVAVRARGIGLASVRASSTNNVTVRPDGQGNNGFLDVRPGASPEFDYLRKLAALAARVHQFGIDVTAVYLRPANHHLIRVAEGGQPNPPGWALRFTGRFVALARAGYLHLYAETCRVLLLQQLRTSRVGILGRTARINRTAADFAQTLDILGETVVRVTTLRMALRHADDTHTTGTVRHVLATPQTVPDPETGRPVEMPPPLDDVPARILADVADAVIERRAGALVVLYRGRAWTDAELQADESARRGLVNQSDPLFLQVHNLESLYRSAQRDPGAVRRYLVDLLAEMERANREMTRRASEPAPGAFFACEASQYVKREGGRDWRGLHYSLQGIHALADEHLRAAVGQDVLYVEAVNDALSRKADLDDLLSAFATVGIIVLGLMCAPLGAVAVAAVTGLAGLALTAHDVLEAKRKSGLYQALEDPELFQRWQEVQLAQVMAAFGIAFSVFDVIGAGKAGRAIAGAAHQGLRVAERAGAGLAARSVARAARREVIRNMTREVLENAVRQAVTEAAVAAAMTQLLPMVLQPVLARWMREVAAEHGTLAEVDAVLTEANL